MTQGVQDNRDFYRIQDKAILEFTKVEIDQVSDQLQDFPLDVSTGFYLLNELNALDQENATLLRAIADKNRDLGNYLKAITHKIELIAHRLVQSGDDMDNREPQDITLSEGGLSFTHKSPLALNTYVAVKLVLLPSHIGLLLYGRVVNCNEHISGQYLINIVFEQLRENDRQLIARHVLQFQAKQRRQNQDSETRENPHL